MASSWDASERAEEAHKQRLGGATLLHHLKLLYAERKMTAKDLAISCFWCVQAGVKGADFASLALGPGQSTGNYQKVVDRCVPPFEPVYHVPTPMMPRGSSHRETRSIPVSPLHEALAREIRKEPGILDKIPLMRWPDAYMQHPAVLRARQTGESWPLPVALYLDGVRYTAPLAGRSDAILGFWAYTAVTERRHFLASLCAQDLCRCGCRNWCSLYPILLTIAWSLRALLAGRRPALRHDSSVWDPEDPVFQLALRYGERLPTAVLVWLKGDWSEVHHSLGLPSVLSRVSPCPFCAAHSGTLHDLYKTFDFAPKAMSYEAFCLSREIIVNLVSETDRETLMGHLEFRKGRDGFGREVKSRVVVNGVALEGRDRVAPSPALLDVRLLDTVALPCAVTLWRPRGDFRLRICDTVIRRNPIFDGDICRGGPAEVLAVDTLHTVHLGVIQRLVSAILWRLLLANSWGIRGSQEHVLELGVRRMTAHMLRYFEDERTPADRRVATLSIPMLGERLSCVVGGSAHPGCAMRLKAAEMSTLLPWSLALLAQYGSQVANREELLAAGRSTEQWLEITKQDDDVLPPAACRGLVDNCMRVLAHCSRACVHFTPKFHFFAHLSLAARRLGNPKVYSCFKDEALNLTLRTIAENSHRAKQELRLFSHFFMLGGMGFSPYLYGE